MNELVPTEKMTLAALLHELAESDFAIQCEIDPARLVGDIRDKVDAIHHVDQRMDGAIAWLKSQAEPLIKAARAIENNKKRLREYVAHAMAGTYESSQGAQRMEMLPGNLWRVQLFDSAPSLEITEPASAELMLKYPDLIEVERTYRWKSDAVKERLKAAMKPEDVFPFKLEDFPFARLTRGFFIKFFVNVPKEIQGKKKGSKVAAAK